MTQITIPFPWQYKRRIHSLEIFCRDIDDDNMGESNCLGGVRSKTVHPPTSHKKESLNCKWTLSFTYLLQSDCLKRPTDIILSTFCKLFLRAAIQTGIRLWKNNVPAPTCFKCRIHSYLNFTLPCSQDIGKRNI